MGQGRHSKPSCEFSIARSLPCFKPSWTLCYSFPVRNSQSVFPQDVHYHACEVSVFDRILQRMQEKVRALDYVMTIHAEEEMEDDDVSILDVERVILTGEIIERQKDQDTGEWKYLIAGNTLADEPIIVVGKLAFTGKLIIITVYRLE
jgi:Domain of unknown function (DUF4258)